MKIFLIRFPENSQHYDAFVVLAKDKEQAIDVLHKKYSSGDCDWIDWDGGYEVTEIKTNRKRPKVIVDSFIQELCY